MAFTPRCGTGRLKVMFIELAMRQSSINKLLRFKWFNDLLRFNVEGSCQITIMLWQFDRTSLPVCAAILDLPRFEWRYEAADQHFLANESTKSHTTNDKIASIGFCSDLGFDLAATIQKTGQVVICDDSGLHWSKTWPKKRSSQACLARQDRSWPQFLSRLGGAMQCIYIYICNVCKATSQTTRALPTWNLASPRRYPGKHCILEGGSNFGVLLSDTELFEFSH